MDSFSPSDNDSNQLKESIENGAFLVDVRTPMEFLMGSAKGSINIPLDELEEHLDAFKEKNGIVVFCRSGARSEEAKMILESYDFINVINGGTWQAVNTYCK